MDSRITVNPKRTQWQELLRGNSECITGAGHIQIIIQHHKGSTYGQCCIVFYPPSPDSHHSNVHTVPRSFNTIKKAMLLV